MQQIPYQLSHQPNHFPSPLLCHLHLTLSSLEASCSGFLQALRSASTQAQERAQPTVICCIPWGQGGAEPKAAKLVVSFELFNYSMFFLYQGLTNRAEMFGGLLSVPQFHLPAFPLSLPPFAHAPASLHTRPREMASCFGAISTFLDPTPR